MASMAPHPGIRGHARSAGKWLAVLPMVGMLVAFCLAPAAWVVMDSRPADGGAWYANYALILASRFDREAFANSLRVSVLSTAVALLVGSIAAASLRRVPGRLRDAVVALVNMSSHLSGVPLAFAFIILLGTNGTLTLLVQRAGWGSGPELYSLDGLVLLYSYFQIPVAVLLLYPAFDAIDDDCRHAATLLGARTWDYWRDIGLPTVAPAIAGAAVLLLANAMGAYASAFALTTGNVNLLTIRIASLVSGDVFLQPDLAAALAVLLMALLGLFTLVYRFMPGRGLHAR